MDIVEKLRELSALEKSFLMSGTCWYEKAADEIEQLREALRQIHGLGDTPDDSWKAYQICCEALGEKE